MHDCRHTEEGMVDLLFGEAAPGRAAYLLAEVGSCERCRAQYRTLADALRAFDRASLAAEPDETYWQGYNERLHAMLIENVHPAANAAALPARAEYQLTLLEDEGLSSRLTRELREVGRASRLTWPEFKRDPFSFTGRTLAAYGQLTWRFFSQRDVAVATLTAFVFVVTAAAGIVALDRLKARQTAARAAEEELQVVQMLMTEIPAEQKEPDPGTAGMAKGKGGGSKPKYEKAGGGGGGGREEQQPASHGKLPPAVLAPQILPPNPHPPAITKPNLPVTPTIDADPALFPPDNRPIPYGDPKSTSTVASAGPGTGGGIGTGTGGGVGSGEGGGVGPGRGGNTGGGDRNEGGGGGGGEGGGADYGRPFRANEVTRKAVITFKPEPQFTEEARKNNVNGLVKLRLLLTSSGTVGSITVVKGLPDGLTERAIQAARQIRFTPAEKDGRRVSQYIVIEYNFNIY
ncbi:MAG TPA: energy transducer TonB [Pyrinomonadaceae bacterium]|nr:energy transducer TonB [Pyrinomonadaceae bacterium]